jgi:hypothetical protein
MTGENNEVKITVLWNVKSIYSCQLFRRTYWLHLNRTLRNVTLIITPHIPEERRREMSQEFMQMISVK